MTFEKNNIKWYLDGRRIHVNKIVYKSLGKLTINVDPTKN